jgi:hypothetical protein
MLRNYAVCHRKQQSVLVENWGGEESCNKQSERIKCERSLSGYCKPSKDSPVRYSGCRKVEDCLKLFLQRQTQGAYIRTRHRPVENSHRIDEQR